MKTFYIAFLTVMTQTLTHPNRDGQVAGQAGSPSQELTKAEVALYFRVTKRTITDWMRQRGLPHLKISRRTLRFKMAAIKEWEAGRSRPSRVW